MARAEQRSGVSSQQEGASAPGAAEAAAGLGSPERWALLLMAASRGPARSAAGARAGGIVGSLGSWAPHGVRPSAGPDGGSQRGWSG